LWLVTGVAGCVADATATAAAATAIATTAAGWSGRLAGFPANSIKLQAQHHVTASNSTHATQRTGDKLHAFKVAETGIRSDI